jgi:hypothetical protein
MGVTHLNQVILVLFQSLIILINEIIQLSKTKNERPRDTHLPVNTDTLQIKLFSGRNNHHFQFLLLFKQLPQNKLF